MRTVFIKTLIELAEQDPRILLLTADIGFMVLEPFSRRFPERFFNVGVAEENMVGVATGLAEAGFIPFVYSIATFVSLRPYEFIRNGPIIHHLPVRIIGVGGGFEYGHNGLTHHTLEDIGIMRIQPGITTIVPADYQQARAALLSTWNLSGPIYYRIGKDDSTIVPGLDGNFEIGRVKLIGEGSDLAIITIGSIAKEATAAQGALAKQGIHSTVLVISSLNPSPIEDLARILSGFKLAISVEAHYLAGGIGSLVSEIIAEYGLRCRLLRCGVKKAPQPITGSQNYLNAFYGLSSAELVKTILRYLKEKK